jgi:hypothetical protein
MSAKMKPSAHEGKTPQPAFSLNVPGPLALEIAQDAQGFPAKGEVREQHLSFGPPDLPPEVSKSPTR